MTAHIATPGRGNDSTRTPGTAGNRATHAAANGSRAPASTSRSSLTMTCSPRGVASTYAPGASARIASTMGRATPALRRRRAAVCPFVARACSARVCRRAPPGTPAPPSGGSAASSCRSRSNAMHPTATAPLSDNLTPVWSIACAAFHALGAPGTVRHAFSPKCSPPEGQHRSSPCCRTPDAIDPSHARASPRSSRRRPRFGARRTPEAHSPLSVSAVVATLCMSWSLVLGKRAASVLGVRLIVFVGWKGSRPSGHPGNLCRDPPAGQCLPSNPRTHDHISLFI